MQHFSNPVIATNERIIIWAVLGFEEECFGFQDGGYASHFGFPNGMILAIFHLNVNLMQHCFNFIRLVVCKLSKTDFLDGCYSGHHGFPINAILTHFDPEVVLLLQSKFRLKSTKVLGRDVENWFLRWRLWWPSWILNRLSFSYFVSTRHPDAPHQLSTQLDVQNMNSQHFSFINVQGSIQIQVEAHLTLP